ncbi:hypothetical protein RHMOL_Rhmol02G0160800 [Rhododendron molle]|uniref:Uncharacterized protein n=2 Tax=Rhododendron molle TaxID=49168 RepID=A0ACC0PS41_RHOML|nr:hypothetical protein RHMOL_Rhmol02G0160800 [Rhododendron molle]KAI8567950.1 hypothetical protein RHMOL_Rhmol02G0160800 [Rhododendron molle]
MTGAVCDQKLKNADGDTRDHQSNHIHLASCIHLKNHMHYRSPGLADRSLVRDLICLQKSRSVRDPSATPASWHSLSFVDLLSKRFEKDGMVGNGRRSVGIEREGRGLPVTSPHLDSVQRAEVAFGKVRGRNDGTTGVSNRSCKSGIREHRRNERGKGGNGKSPRDENGLVHGLAFGNSKRNDKKMVQKGRHEESSHLKTVSEQLKEACVDSDDIATSYLHRHGKHCENEQMREEPVANMWSYRGGLKRGKRCKRRTRTIKASRDAGGKNRLSVASDAFVQSSACFKYQMEEGEEEYDVENVARAPRNGCGIPWNWSRIHHRGKSILDMAGRSLSCGLSDSKTKKGGPVLRNDSDRNEMSDLSNSSTESNAEALPLLVEASGSLESMDNTAWVHDYSGELGICANNILSPDIDADLDSESRSGNQHKFRRHHNGRHQNLSQKYMPRTFRDLVGQNLVAQVLSNAVSRRKVGLLYAFYGPPGTGKTSCARIFAKAINCQSLEPGEPCGSCNSCIAYDLGKSQNIRELGQVSSFESVIDLLNNMIVSHLPSQHRVLIFDDCDALSPDCWSAMSKFIDRAPRLVVFVLVCSSLDVLPHTIISRCQKFFFPKLKDADIVHALQLIETREGLDIDKDAIKLIASRSEGSLRDAKMTLEQLSLLGQRISVRLVQELVGLISDEKLIELLDLALSADTVNTVKNLRQIIESGVEPLALMSQLATLITDILAGSVDLLKERSRRKFFQRQALSKEHKERLRQALKTLSEAEKQLRLSNDRLTWLTAALLQLAPDQQYMFPSSSANISFNDSLLVQSKASARERPRKSNVEHPEIPNNERALSTHIARMEDIQAECCSDAYHNAKIRGNLTDCRRIAESAIIPQQTFSLSADSNERSGRPVSNRVCNEVEEIWLEVVGNIQIQSVKEFMYQEGKLISVSFGAAPTVRLTFSSHLTKSKAEKYTAHILQAFESVLGSPVTIEIKCESKKVARNEIAEIAFHVGVQGNEHKDNNTQYGRRSLEGAWMGDAEASHKKSYIASFQERRQFGQMNESWSLLRSEISLGHVSQDAQGCAHQNGWLACNSVSIAEELEQENLKLEARSRRLLCWSASRAARRKLSRSKIRTRKSQALLRFVSCGNCLSNKSLT